MSSVSSKPTRVRLLMLGLVVLVYFITYLDRVLLSNARQEWTKFSLAQ